MEPWEVTCAAEGAGAPLASGVRPSSGLAIAASFTAGRGVSALLHSVLGASCASTARPARLGGSVAPVAWLACSLFSFWSPVRAAPIAGRTHARARWSAAPQWLHPA